MRTPEPGPAVVAADYRAGVLGHARHGEADRLSLLEQLCDPVTRRIVESLGIPARARILEIGAGSGSVARWLAGHRPHGHVTATDLDIRLAEAAPRPANLTLLRHDVSVDDFPSGEFDLIHARALLTHLPDPAHVLHRITSWLTPGGHLVIEDPTYLPPDTSPYPDFAALLHACEILLSRTQGTDSTWARRIPAAMAAAHITDTAMSMRVAVCGADETEDAFWRACFAQAAPLLIEHRLLDEEQIERALAHLDNPAFTDAAWMMVSCWGRAPDTP